MATLIPQFPVGNNSNHNTSGTSAPSENQILARLDAYLPALNTGLMDGKIQDVIIKHPLVRTLLVPECDLEARRRCIALISKALAAATPVLPLILQDHQAKQDQKKKRQKSNAGSRKADANAQADSPRIPKLSLDAQSRLITIVASMAERDPLIRFWMNHHVQYQARSQAQAQAQSATPEEGSRKRKYSTPAGSGAAAAAAASSAVGGSGMSKHLEMSTFDLYLKIKTSKELLADLADRIQGAVCKAFWDCWDEIFITLAEVIGAENLQQADKGRIFRPCGDAAIYLNNLKVTKKRQVEQKRRLSMLEGNTSANTRPGHQAFYMGNNNMTTVSPKNILGQQPGASPIQVTGQIPSQFSSQNQNIPPLVPASPFSPDQFLNEFTLNSSIPGTTATTTAAASSIPTPSASGASMAFPFPLSPEKSSGSPDSTSSMILGINTASAVSNVPTPPGSTNGSTSSHPNPFNIASASTSVNGSKPLSGSDANDLEFMMQDISYDSKFDQYLGAFTTLDDADQQSGHQANPSHTPSSNTAANSSTSPAATTKPLPSNASDISTPQTSAGSPTNTPGGSHLNLRQRIKLMEEGRMPEENPSPSNIVW
ncbi:hypothetical protein AWJ20_3733 [Sugiyamaella lignohabitans]|uniref:Uncharacterized protein n=1 Tax=Sugiyamaella lignohabitans TaxID=796027 RepID=A0A167BX80_9ASCO|nr:uncharacterized protein AWJ20_3733 [Sugiyamaella lignohabitans]ANB10939.1 hypothetical protein AWJ20_3733 [Sugiyamaella lignohabitans]